MISFACDYLEGAHEDVLRALCENNSEQSTGYGFDAHCKNAADMISSLTLSYNRQRQAVITTELIEIIAGSEALQS